jgi:hypothetical protein
VAEALIECLIIPRLAIQMIRDMIRVPEGRCDRSLARSAWESATQKSRPVGYGVIRAGVRTDSMIGVTQSRKQEQKNLSYGLWLLGLSPRSYRTLRDGSFEGRCPRHFVPGYDRLSLRDVLAEVIVSPMDEPLYRSRWK